MLKIEDLKNVNETELNKKLYVESYNKCFYPEDASIYQWLSGEFDKKEFEKLIENNACTSLFQIKKIDFLYSFTKFKVMKKIIKEIKANNVSFIKNIPILHIPNSLLGNIEKTIDSLSKIEQEVIRDYYKKENNKETINILIKENFFNNLLESLSHNELKDLMNYNLKIMYHNLRFIKEYGFGIYKKTDFCFIEDENFQDEKKVYNTFTVVDSLPLNELGNALNFNEYDKFKFKFLMQEMEARTLYRYMVRFSEDLELLDLLGGYSDNEMFQLLKLLHIMGGDHALEFRRTEASDYLLKVMRNEGSYKKELFLKKIIKIESFTEVSLNMKDFEYLGDELKKLNDLVSKKNQNILIWGAPGNGKTDLVKVLAKNHNKRMLDYYSYNQKRGSLDAMVALKATKSVAKSLDNCWIIIDEAENILKDEKNKIVINNELNKSENTIFWVVNHLDGIDPSILRRFGYIMEFNKVPFFKREEIASNLLGENNVDGLSIKLAQALKTPAEIISSIEWCNETKDFSWKNVITKMVNYQNAISYSSVAKNGGFEIKVILPSENNGLDKYAGYDYVKNQVRKSLNILKNPEKFKKLNGKIPKGLLLMGSAGVGKTLLAQKIANEYQMSIVTAKATSLAEDPIRIKYLFDKARSIAPCIVLLDEIDVLGSNVVSMTGEIDTEKQKILNSLLVEMDGFEKFDGILVIGATHRSYLLDPALLRSGRFGAKLLLRKPEKNDRKEIIKFYMSEKVHKNIDFDVAAKLTSGMSSADLSEIVNIATVKASEKDLDRITQKELLEAIDEVFFGVKTDGLPFSLKDKWRVAIHEGGHALIAMKNGIEIQRATISPHQNFLGMVELHREEEKQCYGEKEILAKVEILLAGMIAEKAILGSFASGNSSDLAIANYNIRAWLFGSGGGESLGLGGFNHYEISNEKKIKLENEIESILNKSRKNVEEWIKNNQVKLVDFAKMLLGARSLDYEEIKEWCKNNSIFSDNSNKEESLDEMIEMAYNANYLAESGDVFRDGLSQGSNILNTSVKEAK